MHLGFDGGFDFDDTALAQLRGVLSAENLTISSYNFWPQRVNALRRLAATAAGSGACDAYAESRLLSLELLAPSAGLADAIVAALTNLTLTDGSGRNSSTCGVVDANEAGPRQRIIEGWLIAVLVVAVGLGALAAAISWRRKASHQRCGKYPPAANSVAAGSSTAGPAAGKRPRRSYTKAIFKRVAGSI